MNGMSVFGKYLSKMKLKQWKGYSWADTEKLKQEAEEKAKLYGQPQEEAQQQLEEIKKAYENGEITEAQYQTYAEIHAPEPTYVQPQAPQPPHPANGFIYPENSNFEELKIRLTEGNL